MYATDNRTGRTLRSGDEVTDFRGTPAVFHRATRAPSTGKSGKIEVQQNDRRQEYYDRVFAVTVHEGTPPEGTEGAQ